MIGRGKRWGRRALAGLLLLAGLATGAWVLSMRGLDRPFATPDPAPLAAQTGGLALLGTSLSRGQPWPETLRTRLAACLDSPLPLHVFARGGATSRVAAEFLPALIAARPRIVLIEYSINDADLRRRMSPGTSRATHAAVIEAVQTALPEARLFLLRLNRAHGTRALLRPRLGTYEALYPALAESHGLGLLDTRAAWAEARAAAGVPALQPDGLHPTPAAADRINAPVLAAQLAAQLALDCPAPPGG